MDRIKFVIAEKSYLVRKGISSIINRIEHASVVKELESLDEINSVICKYSPDFLVINTILLQELPGHLNFKINADLNQVGIGINSGPEKEDVKYGGLHQTLGIYEQRDVILTKLQDLVNEKLSLRKNYSVTTELSDREKTILEHVAKGLTNKEIAEKLFLSTHTVITHRKNITAKLGIKTISGLTVYAILNNIISIGDID